MSQTSIAAPLQAPPRHDADESMRLEPLWRLAGDLRRRRTLIVAHQHGLDLMCGLIRRGCPAATVLRPGDRPDSELHDLLIVSDLALLTATGDSSARHTDAAAETAVNPTAASGSTDAVIRLARRSLGPNGRLVCGVRDGREAAALARRLRLNGFSGLQSAHLTGLVWLRADLRRPA